MTDRRALWEAEKLVSGGHIRLPSYGDDIIEKREEALARGEIPDFSEGLPREYREKFKKGIARLKEMAQEEMKQKTLEIASSGKQEYLKAVQELKDGFKDEY